MTEAMADEFDAAATWTAEAVLALGPDHALPAACRGSGSPAALDWLVHQLGMSPDVGFLDSGAGMGGPAEYAARTTGAMPFLVERAEAACGAAFRLFGRAVVVGDGRSLPCADGSFSVAWSLGVLCTVPDKRTQLGELVRVLESQGMLGLLVYERVVDELPKQPQGNHFPSAEEVTELIEGAGLVICATALLTDFPTASDDWQEMAARVEAWIAQRYAGLPAWQRAQDQQATIRDLIDSALVVGRMVVARAPTRVPRRAP